MVKGWKGKAVRRSGVLPGEARRRGLVTVQVDSFASGESDEVGREVRNYIVSTRRLDGVWSHEVEYKGETWRIPGKVYNAIARHRDSIIREQRRIRAVEQAQRIVGTL